MVRIDTATLISCISDVDELKYLRDIIDARIDYLYKCRGIVSENMKQEE